tara:strand:+ start:312 stop:791 length:480 start_codon:yes stop_codon:yes gene_type:complete
MGNATAVVNLHKNVTKKIAIEVMTNLAKSKWFGEEYFINRTGKIFTYDPTEKETTECSIMRIAMKQKVMVRFLETLVEMNAKFSEPDITFEDKYRVKKLKNPLDENSWIRKPIPYQTFDSATMKLTIDGFPECRVLIECADRDRMQLFFSQIKEDEVML